MKKFKFIVALFTILLFAPTVHAEYWFPISTHWDIDLDSITKESTEVYSVWTRVNVNEDNRSVNNTKVSTIYYKDAFIGQVPYYLSLQAVYYDESGNVVRNVDLPYGTQLKGFPPTSVLNIIQKMATTSTPELIEQYKTTNNVKIPYLGEATNSKKYTAEEAQWIKDKFQEILR